MTTSEGEQVISSGWSAAGITKALKNEETCLEPLDLFADIEPLVREPSVEQDDNNMFQIGEGLISICRPKMKRNCDSEREFEDGNVFDVIVLKL